MIEFIWVHAKTAISASFIFISMQTLLPKLEERINKLSRGTLERRQLVRKVGILNWDESTDIETSAERERKYRKVLGQNGAI